MDKLIVVSMDSHAQPMPDRELAAIAEQVGPTYAELSDAPPVDPALIAHFDLRGGYLKTAEADAKLPQAMELVRQDVAALGV
jgi:hypothetical protein